MTDINIKNITLKSKLLLVGAGGISCEVLKNLVLCGFEDIVVIDLDTIDVSNLNRQFLFQKKHVGQSKAFVAKESAERYNPKCKIEAIHGSILDSKYDVQFYSRFALVINALDTRIARSHVNRMCLAANIPLLESGSAGYLGQTTLILKNATECYECHPKPTQKTYPSCTIRNTPSEPIHCVKLMKMYHLMCKMQLNESSSISSKSTSVQGTSMRQMAIDCDFDPYKLFGKLFKDDINYLL
ncbi:UBA2 [Cordylochernes scorpioides]|uniref:UBA2 n=1 Tax=Cordylochernes scorpioides TaxID=51811 RepID=A0ABY6LYH2_9ARAC|nr:UBA2 [Cordylochernes scorpioides]